MRKILIIILLLTACAKRVKKYYIVKKKKFKEPVLKVLIIENKNPLWIGGTNVFYAVDRKGKRYKFFANQRLKIKRESKRGAVYLEGKRTNLNLPVRFYTKGKGYLLVQGKRYRGNVMIDPFLRVINEVKMEDYLKSVVPLEIGSPFLSNFEALKAQAVCARSYALRKYLERKNNFFHLYGDIRDQVYGGRDAEREITDLAVKLTKGEVVLYRNEIALTLFHSTCGGRTAYFDEAFPGKEFIPYLKSVRCNFHGKDLCKNSPYYRWERRFSVREFKELLSKNISDMVSINIRPQDIIDFRISERGPSGRVKEIRVKTRKGTFDFKGYEIRKLLKKGRNLPSNYFSFKKRGKNVIIIGRGFGHGVGLCQYGALALAKKGVNYERILKFYYSGTKIKKIY